MRARVERPRPARLRALMLRRLRDRLVAGLEGRLDHVEAPAEDERKLTEPLDERL